VRAPRSADGQVQRALQPKLECCSRRAGPPDARQRVMSQASSQVAAAATPRTRAVAALRLWQGTRRYLRATLIALVLGVQAVQAIPEKQVTERSLERPEYRRFLRWVRGIFGAAGIAIDEQTIHRTLMQRDTALLAARRELLAPFAPLFEATSTRQQWALFISAERTCYRLHVDARAAGEAEFHSVYRSLEQDDFGLQPALAYRRVRAIYNYGKRRGPGPGYQGVARYIARRLFASDPKLESVRVSAERLYVGNPGDPLTSSGMEYEITLSRSEL